MSVIITLTVEEEARIGTSLYGGVECYCEALEALVASETPEYKAIRQFIAADTLDLDPDTTTGRYDNYVDLNEQLGVAPELDLTRPLQSFLEDGLALEVSFAVPSGILSESLSEGFLFGSTLESEEGGDPETEIWDCWVLNSQELHPSVYSGFNFNSYATMEGTTYAANKSGIYKLTDEHNEKFQTGVLSPPLDFGMSNQKRFRAGFLGYSGGSPAVKVQVDDGEERILKVTRNKFPMGRDQVGRRWVFALADFDTLDFVELIPIVLNKSR